MVSDMRNIMVNKKANYTKLRRVDFEQKVMKQLGLFGRAKDLEEWAAYNPDIGMSVCAYKVDNPETLFTVITKTSKSRTYKAFAKFVMTEPGPEYYLVFTERGSSSLLVMHGDMALLDEAPWYVSIANNGEQLYITPIATVKNIL